MTMVNESQTLNINHNNAADYDMITSPAGSLDSSGVVSENLQNLHVSEVGSNPTTS